MIKKMIAMDWLGMKTYQKWWLFILFYAVIGCFTLPHTVLPVVGLCFFYLSATPFWLEEKDDLNYLYLTLPIKRSEIVSGRYAFSFVTFICGMLIGSVFIPVIQPFSLMNLVMPDMNVKIGFSDYIALLSASYLVYAILNLSSFPCLFKLGYTKGKMWGYYMPPLVFVILITAVVIIVAASEATRELAWKAVTFASENTLLMSIGMTVLATIILAVSYLISLTVYSKRDF